MAGAELEQASEDAEEEEGVGRQRQKIARAGSRTVSRSRNAPGLPNQRPNNDRGVNIWGFLGAHATNRPSGGTRAPGSDTTEQSLKEGGRM